MQRERKRENPMFSTSYAVIAYDCYLFFFMVCCKHRKTDMCDVANIILFSSSSLLLLLFVCFERASGGFNWSYTARSLGFLASVVSVSCEMHESMRFIEHKSRYLFICGDARARALALNIYTHTHRHTYITFTCICAHHHLEFTLC